MSALGWDDLGNVVPIRGYDKEALKREIPLEWVAWKYGIELVPDTSGTRLEGVCPFREHTGRKFTVRAGEDGGQVAGCWACPDRWQGDLFELLGWLSGETDFGKRLQLAGSLAEQYRADEQWKTRPAVVLQPAPKQDPAVFTSDAAVGVRTAIADPRLLQQLIDRKARTDPGWRRLTPEFLISQWQVGAEPDSVENRSVSNPDAGPYEQHRHVIKGSRVLVPHYSWDPENSTWIVRGLKTRNAQYGHLIAAPGSDLKGSLYGVWRMRPGIEWALVCEGEGDAWCASAIGEISGRMDVVSVPTGVKGQPSAELLAPLAGRHVVLAFDGDTDGRYWTGKWAEALRGVAASVWVVALGDGLDLASCPDLLSAVGSAHEVRPDTGSDGGADPGSSPDASDPAAVSAEHSDDIANAELFVAQHREHLRWSPARKMWLVYDGRRWVLDSGDAAMRAGVITARSLFDIRLERMRTGTGSVTDLEALLKRARAAGARGRITAMLEIGRAYMTVREEELDADPWALNFRNGTLDLRTGQLRAHSADDMITRMSPVDFDPGARSPRWEQFLLTVIPDPSERAFLQRVAGSALAGVIPDEKFFVLQGHGGSGKSTFTESLVAAMGDYATAADVEMFLRSQRPKTADNADPAMAALVGRRLVVTSEPPKGRQWDEGKIKRLTGGGTMTTRDLYGKNFDFRVTFTLVAEANLRTAADGDAGGGMSRRLVEVPFPNAIGQTAARDDALKDELTDARRSGAAVMAWAVAGCLAWQRGGLAVPAAVVEATADYWREQIEDDPVYSFLTESYVLTGSANDVVERSKLFDHFKSVTHSSWSRKTFMAKLRELSSNLGIAETKRHGYYVVLGLKRREPLTWDVALSVNPVTEST